MKARRGLLGLEQKPRRIIQDFAGIDQFGEVAGRKREAAKVARAHGHDLSAWHKRKQDPCGRFNAFCVTCNRPVVVCTEPPDGFPVIYGKALQEPCA